MRTMVSLDKSASGISITGYDILISGVALFLVSSGLFVLTHGVPQYHTLVFGLFFITNIVNIIAVFFLLREMAHIFRAGWFRFITHVLYLPILLFAVLSTVDFFSFATASFFQLHHPINMMAVNISTAILGQQVLEQGVIGLTYVYLIPLQAVAYVAFLIMIGVHLLVEKRKGRVITIPFKLILCLVIFFVMALLAVADTMYAFQLING